MIGLKKKKDGLWKDEIHMPYKIKKGKGPKPWKIIAIETGKVVGSSTTKQKAEASVHARLAGAHGWKGTKRKVGTF